MNSQTIAQPPKASNAFLESNSLVAIVAFLLLVLIAFIIILRSSVSLMSWLFSPSRSPHLFDGMVDSKHMMVIHQDPSKPGAVPIVRSINQNDGIEFTWSVWIYIDDLQHNKGIFKHIFHKGNDALKTEGMNQGMVFPNNAPGLYLAPFKNDLVVVMNTFNKITEKVTVKDVPLNKWLNVILRVENTTLDVYINGTIVKRHKLSGVPKQNYGDVFVSMNGGFNGYTSNLWYWDYALGTTKIQNIVDKGPDMTMRGSDMKESEPRYFSMRWFFNNVDSTSSGYGGI